MSIGNFLHLHNNCRTIYEEVCNIICISTKYELLLVITVLLARTEFLYTLLSKLDQ